MKERKGVMLRFPEALHIKLVKEAGERTAKTGQRASVNQVVIDIVEAYFEKKTKRG